jgi:hypothetical protein
VRRGDGTERPCAVRVELNHLRRAHGSVWARVCAPHRWGSPGA